MDHHSSMKMFFHYGYEDQFLFKSFGVDTPLKMWFTCGVLFALSVLFEAIKYVRCVRCGCVEGPRTLHCSNGTSNGSGGDLNDHDNVVRLARNCYVGRLRSQKHRLIQTLLHTIQTALGFVLMLSVMSFNVCLIFAILVGNALGYFIFYRSYNEIEAIENCH